MLAAVKLVLVVVCVLAVVLGTLPVFAGAYQFLLVAFSYFRSHLEDTASYLPRLSILIPAWNEGSVIGTTLDRLMKLEYPMDRLRVYVIDDASNDATPAEVIKRNKLYPHNVFHIRRVAGGEGKAHTLNYGLLVLWSSEWTQAVLIMDADVIYTATSIARMARHLVDPKIGAITAYVKEGSRSPSYVQRFVSFEYITATGASRRAQNVLGVLACLSGGAQLHSRENLLAIGGQIFSDTLAEDTFTTFRTQLAGRAAIFEPNAIVYAEEPDALGMLWKQRLRWARGNVQITTVFMHLWMRRRNHAGLGSISMSLLWFSIFLMPLFQIGTSLGLISLYFLDAPLAWTMFRIFWIVASLVYLLVTGASVVVDPESARPSWLQGILFPGVISLTIIVNTLCPPLLGFLSAGAPSRGLGHTALVLFLYAWLSLSMVVSWSAVKVEKIPRLGWLAPVMIYVAGYGSLLCAVTFGAYIKEMTGAAKTWDKTEKTGKVG
jgi:cellulose synthase/poly-beta-1,6-N-acetylglucosamine synthase-like glycosyltransferase